MREVQIRTWCDVCADQDSQAEGTTTPELMGGMTLDLCLGHLNEYVMPLQALLDAHGVRVDGKPRRATKARQRPDLAPSADSWPCPLCDVVKPNDHQLKSHAGRAHGVATLLELFGTSCTLCGFQGSRRLGQHTQAAHGLNVAQAAAAGAKKAS